MSCAQVHQSLSNPITIMGLPRKLFWLNALISFDMFMLGAWWLIFISILIHIYAVKVCKQDPEILDVLIRYYKDGSEYLEG